MTMHTEIYCETMAEADPAKMVRAIHAAWIQLGAVNRGVECLDNGPAMAQLAECLRDAGHVGFIAEEMEL